MEEKDKQKQGFKVNDRRMFDSSGNPKDESPTDSKGGMSSSTRSSGATDGTLVGSPSESTDIPEINLSSFVVSLATQAMMQLGEIPPPPGVPLEVDVVSAKQTIEILSLLRVKTKGNLDDFEEKLFEEVLHNVRMSYVRATKK